MRPSVIRKLQEAAGQIDFTSPSLSFRRLREVAEQIAELHEANAESSFGYLLKAAVQEYANDSYKDLPVVYPQLVTEINSKRRSEVYGGLYRPNLPKPVDAGEKFHDTSFKGFERELVNHKYGHIETFERELFDDDQTGQVRTRASNLGEGFKTFEEIYVLSRLFGAARTEEGIDIAASNWTDNGTPGCFTTALGNRPSTYTRLSQDGLEAAHITMRSMKDPLGRKFLVVPRFLLVSPEDEFTAYRILNSPLMANTATATTAAQVNPLQGRYTPVSSPFVKAYAWLLGDMPRGFVFQRRDPLEIIQESPNSGDSFRQEVYAFRARERFEADWIEPRFAYLGNNGDVTS